MPAVIIDTSAVFDRIYLADVTFVSDTFRNISVQLFFIQVVIICFFGIFFSETLFLNDIMPITEGICFTGDAKLKPRVNSAYSSRFAIEAIDRLRTSALATLARDPK